MIYRKCAMKKIAGGKEEGWSKNKFMSIQICPTK